MLVGILYVLAACLFWSAVFVIPALITGFTPLEISLGRFFVFGLVSLGLILVKKRELFQRSYGKIWKKAFAFGFLSTIACYTLTVFCIRYASSAMAALLFGTIPIIVALLGNFRRKEYPFRLFLFPCLAMGIGILIANKEAFLWEGNSLLSYGIGVVSGIAGMACWVWYVIGCFDFMEDNTQISAPDWVMMLGSAVFCQVIIFGAAAFWMTDDLGKYCRFTKELQYFLGGTVILGVVSSWLALYCWTQGNRRLPISLTGQLFIAESVFGLALIYIVESRAPSFMEGAGIALMIAGVLQGLRSLKKARASNVDV